MDMQETKTDGDPFQPSQSNNQLDMNLLRSSPSLVMEKIEEERNQFNQAH